MTDTPAPASTNERPAEDPTRLQLYGRQAKFGDSVQWRDYPGLRVVFIAHAPGSSCLIAIARPAPETVGERYAEVLSAMEGFGYKNGPCLNIIIGNDQVSGVAS